MNLDESSARYWVIIPAAGSGQRMQADCPKQYLKLNNKTVLEHTLAVFDKPELISGIVIVLADLDPYWPDVKQSLSHFSVPLYTANGGQERCDSVLNAMKELQYRASAKDWVLVHDAARPCVTWHDIRNLISALKDESVGGLLGSPLKDTIKRSDTSRHVTATVDRSQLWRALTPQMFRFDILHKALKQALIHENKATQITDDASAVEQLGYKPLLVEGSGDNIKITTPEDMLLAEIYLSQKS